jgi:hypothetical protein
MTVPDDTALWSWMPPAQTRVECAGENHWIRWESGRLIPLDHSDVTGERTLAALGRQQVGCFELLDLWNRHSGDLRVLALSSRGPGDPLGANAVVNRPHPPGQAIKGSVAVSSAVARPAPSGSWFGYGPPPRGAPRPGPLTRPVGVAPGPLDDDPVARLITLSGPLADRLAATVAATWEERERAGGPDAEAARPAMIAALHGRATSAMRTWLGAPGLEVTTTLPEGDTPRPGAARDPDGAVRLCLPFAWIRTVWATGLSTILGRFTLRVLNADDEQVTLETLGPDFGSPQTIRISVQAPS